MLEVGKEAMCVRGHESGVGRLITGKLYNIEAIKKGYCTCAAILVSTGMDEQYHDGRSAPMGSRIKCRTCGTHYVSDGLQWYNYNRFAPIDSVDISEALEVLEKEAFKI